MMLDEILHNYPELLTLRGKVPDEIIEREVSQHVVEYEEWRALAQSRIPTALLGQVFPAPIETGRITLERFLGQWGNVSVEELCKLCLITAWAKPKLVFEFGTFNGMTTYQLALNMSAGGQVYTIDIRPEQAGQLELDEIDKYLAAKAGAFQFVVGHYFHHTECEGRITQMWGDSTLLDLSPYFGQVDLVFIDAGHSYPYVSADSENALKMIRPGGIIIWHDYLSVLSPAVTRYLGDKAQAGLQLAHLRGTHLAVHRSTPT